MRLTQGFLVGQQFDIDGNALETRVEDQALIFTPHIDIENASEAQFRVNGGGLADVNFIRSKRGVPALGALTLFL